MRKLMLAAAFALPLVGGTAMAQETVKIGYIDPLSGGGASVGEIGLKTFNSLPKNLMPRVAFWARRSRSSRSTTRPIRRKA